MKHLAVSLGSISLVLMQNGHSQTIDSAQVESDTVFAAGSEYVQEEFDAFSFSDASNQDLEAELLSLEQELEQEQTLEALEGSSVAIRQQEIEDKANRQSDEGLLIEPTTLDGLLDPMSAQSLAPGEIDIQIERISADLSDMNSMFSNSMLSSNTEAELLAMDDAEEALADESEIPPIPNYSQDKETQGSITAAKKIEISLQEVVGGSPIIYLALLGLSVASFALWLINALTLSSHARSNDAFVKHVKDKLMSNHFEDALSLCEKNPGFLSKILCSAISSRNYGLQFMLESMKSEGKRASISFWQRLNFLYDIAIIAPMIGLLGTVLGMFYAFYDLNRSFESISALFDGLGVSVGTTVAGIFVAILAMVLHSFSKYRLVKSLTLVENEAVSIARLIESHKYHH
ncbi:MAG: MotA/TolQ/ExbB proton channel family protein [Chlamydiae bacterium]|nr:MotA/TolQ/ExbB proton channel family protein [Chlamydiota bacterium]